MGDAVEEIKATGGPSPKAPDSKPVSDGKPAAESRDAQPDTEPEAKGTPDKGPDKEKPREKSAEELAVAEVLRENGKADMPMEEIQKALEAKGIHTRVVERDGKKELQFLDKSGNVTRSLRDTSGDGQLGMQDGEFADAVRALEAEHPELRELELLARSKNGEDNGYAGYAGMLGNLSALRGLGAVNIEGKLRPVQRQLDSMSYTGDTAVGLWRSGELPQVAEKLGIQLPRDLPAPTGDDMFKKIRDLTVLGMIPFTRATA